jgi:uncharacterized membrane protein
MDNLIVMSLFVAFLSAIQIIMMKRASTNISNVTMISIYASIYFVFSLVYMTYHKETISNELKNIAMPVIFLVAAAAALSFIGNLLYYRLLSSHHASVVTALISTVPIFLLFMLRDSITYTSVVGVFAIIIGILLLS